jgi:DNA repair ATPase RecN
MPSKSNGSSHEPNVIPLAPASKSARDDADQFDKAGQTILQLLQSAANVAEEDSRRARDMVQKLSHHLHAAEDRIAELEAEVGMYQDKADRAEQWLHRVYTELENRFLRQDDGRRGAPRRRQGVHNTR